LKELMTKLTVILVVVFCCSISIQAGHQNGELRKKLNDYFIQLKDEGTFSGTVLITQDNKVLLQRGYGLSNYEINTKNKPNTVFAISSMTKAFTSISIMMLSERGLLDIHDTVSNYIPEFPHGDIITLHQLLNHTSGLYLYLYNPYVWENSSNFHTPDELLSYYMNEPLSFSPGTQWEYCNSGYVTLGIIIERVSGMSYRDFIRMNILEPLNMKGTSYDPYEVDFPDKAIGYDDISVYPPIESMYFHPSIAYSAGAVYSTVRDLYKLDKMFYTEKLLSYDSLDQIFTPGLGNYGYGWFIDNLEVNDQWHKQVWHYGEYFGFHSVISRLVEDKVTIILLLNISGVRDHLEGMVKDVASMVLQ
jgi:CubicO group peptidase (beta-lactamase class C family)